MDDVKRILITYWPQIVAAIVMIFSIILQCFKKKPVKVVDTVKEWILELLPFFIREAEEKFASGQGVNKKEYVISKMSASLIQNFGLSDELLDNYKKFISSMIEAILWAPQKK